jgi:hypothetical protein
MEVIGMGSIIVWPKGDRKEAASFFMKAAQILALGAVTVPIL